ncbi:hypothetical protein FRC07_000540, partial [Ceratobasidium sp. 392]
MSRPPTSGGNGLVYDEKLLDQAPQVTKGQRQEGYDADILNPPVPTRTPPVDFNERNTDIESGSSPNEKHLAAGGYDPMINPAKKPFWKTTKGLIILAVVALVVIAAAVGGGVGGTVGKNKNSSNNLGSANNSTSTNTPTDVATVPSTPSPSGNGDLPTGSSSVCHGRDCPSRTSTASTSPTFTSNVSPGAQQTLTSVSTASVALPPVDTTIGD